MSAMTDNSDGELQKLFDTFLLKAKASCDTFTNTLRVPPQSLVYHYTNDVGLRGILETGKLWFTDVSHLNDPTELKHGLNYAIELLQSKASKGSSILKSFTEQFVKPLKKEIPVASFFACCFSQAGDDLGQWRAYADDGRGYSLGFDCKILEQAFVEVSNRDATLISTSSVVYSDKRLHEVLDELIVGLETALSSADHIIQLPPGSINNFMRDLSVELAISCLHLSLFFKHEAYINEREYKFLEMYAISQPIQNLKFRSRPYSLIRYKEFDWKSVCSHSLKEIMIGPAADEMVAKQFVDECIRVYLSTATPIIKIDKSRIPYRSKIS